MMKGDISTMNTDDRTVLKFVMAKLKHLIRNERGDTSYMENLDEIFKDIFGVKNFTKRIDDCLDDKEVIATINEVGIRNLMTICNTPRLYNVFAELVAMNAYIYTLSRQLRKAEKKGKHKDKDRIKELNFISEKYKEAVKTLRKKFGVSRKASYKKRFSTVIGMIDSRKGFANYDDDDDDLSSILYDGNEYDDDDDDDDRGLSDFEKYARRAQQARGNIKKKAGKLGTSANFNVDSDDDEDDDDDDDDDDTDNEVGDKIDQLSNTVSTLASSIQVLVNRESSSTNSRPAPSQPSRQAERNQPAQLDTDRLSNAIMMLVENAKKSNDKLDAVIDLIQESAYDDDDDDEDDIVRPSIITGDINVYPETQPTKKRPGADIPLTRDDVIDIVNNGRSANSGNVTTQVPPQVTPPIS